MFDGFLLFHKTSETHSYPTVQFSKESIHISHTEVVAKPAKRIVEVVDDLLHVPRLLTPSQYPHSVSEVVKTFDARPKIPPVHQKPDKLKRSFLVMHDACLLRVQLQMQLTFDDTLDPLVGLLCFLFFCSGGLSFGLAGFSEGFSTST